MNTIRLAVLAASLATTVPVHAQTLEPQPPSDAIPVMSLDTGTFVAMVKSSDYFEIRSSELAKERAESDEVKALARTIVADHAKAQARLMARLRSPRAPELEASDAPVLHPKHRRMLAQLEAASGKEFETLYLEMQAQAHMEAVSLFRTYAAQHPDKPVVGFAKETLPRLETHLGHVKELIAAD